MSLFFFLITLFGTRSVLAQPIPTGAFTDGHTMTFELREGAKGIQGQIIFFDMDTPIPLMLTPKGGQFEARANMYGEELFFILEPSDNYITVTSVASDLISFIFSDSSPFYLENPRRQIYSPLSKVLRRLLGLVFSHVKGLVWPWKLMF